MCVLLPIHQITFLYWRHTVVVSVVCKFYDFVAACLNFYRIVSTSICWIFLVADVWIWILIVELGTEFVINLQSLSTALWIIVLALFRGLIGSYISLPTENHILLLFDKRDFDKLRFDFDKRGNNRQGMTNNSIYRTYLLPLLEFSERIVFCEFWLQFIFCIIFYLLITIWTGVTKFMWTIVDKN